MTPLSHALIPALWAVWVIYWLVAASNAKQNQRKESRRSRLMHLLPFGLCGLLLATPHLLGHFMEQRFIARTETWYWLGAALVGIGLAFAITARFWLGSNWSAIVTLKKDHELIQSGPYAVVRNPIYSGMLLAVIGTALAVGKYRALVALALITAAIIRKIAVEEKFLAEQFGEQFARYRARVSALVPFIY